MEDKDRSNMTSSDGWTFLPSENNSRRNSTEATDVTPTGQILNQYEDDQSSIEEIPIPDEEGVTDRQTDDEDYSLSTAKPDMMRMSSNSSGSSVSSTFRFLNHGSESPVAETLGPKVLDNLDLRDDDLHDDDLRDDEDDDIYVQDAASDPDDFVKVGGGGANPSVPEVGGGTHHGVTEDDDTQDLSNMSWMNRYDDMPTDQQCIRCYRHMPNNQLNATLTNMTLIAVVFVVGIGVGHYIGEGLDMTPEAEMYRRQAEQCQALFNLQTVNPPRDSVNRPRDSVNQPRDSVNPPDDSVNQPHDSVNPPHDSVNLHDDPVTRPNEPVPNYMKVLHYDHMTSPDMMSELSRMLEDVHSYDELSANYNVFEEISGLVSEFAWRARNGLEPDHPERRVEIAFDDLLEFVYELRREYNIHEGSDHHRDELMHELHDKRQLIERVNHAARVWKVMYLVNTEIDQWMSTIHALQKDIIACHDDPNINIDCPDKISELREKTFDWLKLYENFTMESDSSLFDVFLVESVKAYSKGTDYFHVQSIVNKTKATLSAFRASVHKALPSQVHDIVNSTKKTISSIKQSVKQALPSWEGVKEGASTVKENVVNNILPTIQEQAGDIKASVKSGWQSVKNKLFTENDAGDNRGTYDGESETEPKRDNDGILPAFKDKVTRGWRSVTSKLFRETDSVLNGDVVIAEKVEEDMADIDYDDAEDVYIEDGDLEDDEDPGYFTDIYDHGSHYNDGGENAGDIWEDYLDDDLEDDDGVESVEENISRTAYALSGQDVPEHDDNALLEEEEEDGDIKDRSHSAQGGDNREGSNTLGGDNSAHSGRNNEGLRQEVRDRSMDRSGDKRHRREEIHYVYDELEEFENEVEKGGNGHMGKLGKWFSCQKQWLKARITNSHRGNLDLLKGCKKQLTKWQKADCKAGTDDSSKNTNKNRNKNPDHKNNKKDRRKRKNKKQVENDKKWRREDDEYKHEDKMRKLDKKRQHKKDQKRNENERKTIERQKNVNRRKKKKVPTATLR